MVASSSLVAKDFGYDSLSSSGNQRWLISQDYRTKKMALLNTETDAIKLIGKHESATVLPDGKLLFVKGAEITVGETSCEAEMHLRTVDPKTENLHLTVPVVTSSK